MAGTRDKKELSPNQIREIKAALDYLSGRVEEIAKEMESRKIPKILVRKFKTFVRVKGLVIGTTGAFQEGLDTAVTATPAWDLDLVSDSTILSPKAQDALEVGAEVSKVLKEQSAKKKGKK